MKLSPTRLLALAALLLVAGACSDDPAPAEIRFSRSALAFDAVGDSAVVVATVFDEGGKEMRGRTVDWTTNNPGVARVSSTGVVTSVGPGSGSVLATSGKASATLAVSVDPAINTLQSVSGTGQSGAVGEPLPQPLVVEARDRLGNLAAGADLQVVVDAGGGQVSSATLTTDASGRAQVVWTLGPQARVTQQVRIRSADQALVATFFTARGTVGPAAEVVIVSGGGQVGRVSATLPAPVRLKVTDRFGNARGGDTLNVVVSSGGGSVDLQQVVTDSLGTGEVVWTLGDVEGEQALSASVGEASTQVLASALAGPSQLRIVQGSSVTGTVGEPVQEALAVRLEDALGDGVPGVPVRFRIPDGDGSVAAAPEGPGSAEILVVTDLDGVASPGAWILGTLVGTHELEAAFPGIDPVRFTATAGPGAPSALFPDAGDFQSGTVLQTLPLQVGIRVEDRFGNAVPGVEVGFSAAGGSGSVSTAMSVSGPDGIASTGWTLGAFIGLQKVTATSPGLGSTQVHAAGLPATPDAFSVEVQFLTEVSPEIWAVFQLAGARWRRVIVEDLPDMYANLGPSQCGSEAPAISRPVDDLLVLATVEPIDGNYGTLGSAGPCWIRSASKLPFLGRMRLDVADLERMLQNGTLLDVITHEIGHVIGVGTLWSTLSLLQDPSLNNVGADTHFTGQAAVAAFDEVGGVSYAGAKVPVENEQGGAGTKDSHWRESVMDKELMTGFIDPSANPLSIVTAASLADMGYTVDLDAADSFSLAPGFAPTPFDERIHMINDVLWLPLRIAPEISPAGSRIP